MYLRRSLNNQVQTTEKTVGLSASQQALKRCFDICISFLMLVLLGIPIVLMIVAARFSTGSTGLFRQERIGRHGKAFIIYKIRTLKETTEGRTPTGFGRFLRRFKLDELPQLYNVLKGDMSLVGPRPDIPGYADILQGDDRIILTVRPGITGPATLKYKNEEEILKQQPNPQWYNDEVIWKDKVEINKKYVAEWSFFKDLYYLGKTVV